MTRGGAVVLASGGLDSSLCLAIARRSPGPVLALGFDYGQRNRIELDRLRQIAARLGCEVLIVKLDMTAWVARGLVGGAEVPQSTDASSNYVPARNLAFLGIGASVAEARHAERLYLGVGASDFHHPDCTPAFLDGFRHVLSAGLHDPPVLRAPLAGLSKGQIVVAALESGVPIELTWSCHRAGPAPCGECAACRLRRETFLDLGIEDPGNESTDAAARYA